MYGKIKAARHSGQVHLNLEDQVGEPFVEGEFVTEIAFQDSKFVERAGDTMIGDLRFEGTNQVITRNIDSGQNSNLNLKHNGTTRIFVGGSAVSINNSLVVKNGATTTTSSVLRANEADDGNGDNILYVQKKPSGGDQLRYYGVTFNLQRKSVDGITSPLMLQLCSPAVLTRADSFVSGCLPALIL